MDSFPALTKFLALSAALAALYLPELDQPASKRETSEQNDLEYMHEHGSPNSSSAHGGNPPES